MAYGRGVTRDTPFSPESPPVGMQYAYTVEYRKKLSTPRNRYECEAQSQTETVAKAYKSHDFDMLLVHNGP